MSVFRKSLALLLAAVLLVSVLPAFLLQARAEESETQPEEAEVQTVEVTQDMVPGVDLPESEELYDGYVSRVFYGDQIAFLGVSAREQLGARGQKLYDYLKEHILKVAAGETASAVTAVSTEQIVGWGGSAEYIVDSANTALSSFKEEFEVENVINALLHDCPYELYWYDKVSGVREVGSFRIISGGFSISSVTFKFAVAGNYQPENYDSNNPTFDTGFIKSASAAAANAQTIVTGSANSSDRDMLTAYKDRICALVSYNSSAPSNGNFSVDDDPWQLIYVFDGDSSTNVVCEGYAKAFQYLCDISAFSGDTACYTVTGNMSGGVGSGSHMWNIVTLAGGNYLADITNSDSGTAGQDGSRFLVGAAGDISNGYSIGGSVYTYDADTLALWGTDESSILKLAQSDDNTGSGGEEEAPSTALPFSDAEWEVLKLVNTERYAEGLNPLTGFDLLQQAMDIRAAELVEYYSHSRPDGTDCFTILPEVGIYGYRAAGENIAWGYPTPAAVMNGWMNSSGHRANILSGDYSHIGIGCEGTYWVQMFVGSSGYTALDVVVPNTSYPAGTAIEDMGLYAVLSSNVYGECYLPILSAYCTGYDPTLCETQAVTVSVLGFTDTIEIPISGHDVYVNEAVAAGCTNTGLTEGRYCNVCGEILTAQEEIPALGHTEATIAGKAATCTETGLTDGKKCSTCNTVTVKQETITAKGHSETTIAGKTATCTATGLTDGKKCGTCGAVTVKQETIAAKGHSETTIAGKAATCTATGLTEGKKCSTCGTITVKQETIAAKGHNAVKDKAVAATCGKEGKTEGSHCSVCNTVITAQKIVVATGNHTYSDDRDASCNVCGHTRDIYDRPTVHMFRMYDPNSGEHFYTGSVEERENLVAEGWNYEGVGFTFPLTTGKPVYRLYDPVYGEHLYTMDEEEKARLEAAGWSYEGIAFNSGFEDEVPQYRLHNPNETRGAYHFTASIEERDYLLSIGWEYQGIGWYSCWK